MSADTRYFLCANTGSGFYSIYDEITRSENTRFLYIIKGGPGCGKSDFLSALGKSVGEKGYDVEYFHCSGNPDSLDGIYLPAFGTAYLDGTAPHVLEPDYPGAAARYIGLDEFYDAALAGKKDVVKNLTAEYKAYSAKACKYLAAADEIGRDIFAPLYSENIADIITRRTNGICAREFTDTGRQGAVKRRFLSAFTYEGTISRFDTVRGLCERVCIIDNEYGFAPYMLRQILDSALKCGYEAILCPSPLSPDTPLHLLIPELSLAFISVTAETPYDFDTFKHVRLDALIDKEKYHDLRHTLREENKLYNSLLEKARQNLLFAKSSYDRLEAAYSPHADSKEVLRLAEKHSGLYK